VYTRAAVTLADLAARLGCTLEGDGAIEIARVNSLDNAGPGDLTFLANSKYAPRVATTRASALICDDAGRAAPCAILRTRQPYLAFRQPRSRCSRRRHPGPAGISPLAAIDPTATMGADVAVGPFAVIGPGARVGARTVIHAHAVIGPGATIGSRLPHPCAGLGARRRRDRQSRRAAGRCGDRQ
jgi:UDP-3-O-[3-hydroxymyristoyl] glucosamine N-acyltransferase